jgi:hypothetical protein
VGDPYHPIYESLWSDLKFADCPDPTLDRAFFAFLCSHHRTRPAGIYPASPEILAAEFGRPKGWVEGSLARLTAKGCLRVEAGVVWIVKYLHRQPNKKTPNYKIAIVLHLKRIGVSHPLVQEFLDTYRTLGGALGNPKLRLAQASPTTSPHPPSSILHPPSSIPHSDPPTTVVPEVSAKGEGNGLSTWPPEWDPLKAKIEALPFLKQHVAWLDDLSWWITLDEWLTSAPKPLDELLTDAVAHIVSSGYVPRTKQALRAKIKNCLHVAGRIAEREAQRKP